MQVFRINLNCTIMHRCKILKGDRVCLKSCVAYSNDAVFYQPPIYESLLVEHDDVLDVTAVNNDIYLLLNQNRLSALGEDNVKKILDSIASQSSPMSELRKKVSDSDLLSFCKSRYIQTPSELRSWSNYLNTEMSDLVQKYADEHNDDKPSDTPGPSDTPAPPAE